MAQLERRSVPIITLDHLAANVIGVYPEVVKIGAEGLEPEVMKGAGTLIGKTELFLLRVPLFDPPPHWHSFLEIVSMMDSYGYVPYDFTSFQKRHARRNVASCEIAFVRDQGISGSLGEASQTARRAA